MEDINVFKSIIQREFSRENILRIQFTKISSMIQLYSSDY